MRELDIDRTAHDFQFTRSWFLTRNLPTFRQYIYPEWANKQAIYLELGVFEGMSMTWMMQHVLTNPDSAAYGIDPWLITTKLSGEEMEEVMKRAFHNTSPYSDRCTLIRGSSAEVLRRMASRHGYQGIRRGMVDICMIDGDHNELAVLDDARLVLELLKPGGLMMLDDVENDKPKEHHVKQGLQMFLDESGDKVSHLWTHRYMRCFKKL